MMKPTGIIRNVDELGRVLLPIETRRALGIEEKDGLEILIDVENGQIVLQKATRMCIKCKSPGDLKEIKSGHYICSNCVKELM